MKLHGLAPKLMCVRARLPLKGVRALLSLNGTGAFLLRITCQGKAEKCQKN